MNEAEREHILGLCRQAGVTPGSMWDHPEHGLCVSLSGVRKLAVIAPDQSAAYALLRQLEGMAGPGKTGLQ
jgi:hypothetical protein